jgi:hypothetical protein
MAIKITTEAIVKVIKPKGQQFSLEELNEQVDGWIEPLKIGPLWIMYREKAKEEGEEMNQIASFFFDVAIYGTVMVVSPQEMPTEWDLLDESENSWTADQIESGFLTALQSALIYNRLMNSKIKDTSPISKEEWSFKPSDEVDDSLKDFFRKSYDLIVAHKDKPDATLLFEDDTVIVRTANKTDHIKALDQMINYFIEEEEYEKCAQLQKIKQSVVEETPEI